MRFSKEFLQNINDGETAYLIVSSKAIASAYAEEFLDMAPNEGVIFNVPIYSFDDFLSHFSEKFDLHNIKVIDNIAREIIITEILSLKAQKFKDDNFFLHSRRSDFIATVAEAIKDLKSADVSPVKFLRLLSEETKHSHLAEIYKEYEDFLSQRNLIDKEGLVNFIAELTANSSDLRLEAEHFYFEDLYDLGTVQRKLIDSIAKRAKTCVVSFSETTDESLRTWHKVISADLENSNFEYIKQTENHEPSISLLEAANQSEEAMRVAALIKHLILEEGYLAKDICLVTNSYSNLHLKLSHNLKEANVPGNLKIVGALSSFPAISACLDLLSSALRKYEKLDVMKLYTHRILGGGQFQVSLVKRGLKKKSLRMDLETWKRKVKDNADFYEFLKKLDFAWKEVSLNKKYSFGQLTLIAKRMFRALSIEENILAIENLDEKATMWSFWNRIQELLKDIESAEKIVPKVAWSWDEFVSFLRSTVSRMYVESSHNLEQGISILSPYDLFGQSFEVVILSGMNEGDFPRMKQNGWILTRSDRDELSRKGVRISRGIDSIIKGKAALYAALEASSKRLFVSYSKEDDEGQALTLSPIAEEVLKIEVTGLRYPQGELAEKIISSKDMQMYISRMVSAERDIFGPGLYVDETKEMVLKLRDIYSDKFTRYDGILSEDGELVTNIKSHLIEEDIWSASTLKHYIECPFKFLCSKLLKIEDVADMEEEAGALDMGVVSHDILNRTFGKFKGKYVGNEAECKEYVDYIADETFAQIDMDKVDIHKSVWNLQKATLIKKIKDILDQEIGFISEGQWAPTYFEWSFGQNFDPSHQDPNSTKDPLELDFAGEKLKFKGIVDRIDVNHQGMMAIYDYKLGACPEASDILNKIDIQIALYILAVGKLLKKSLGEVVGGSYYSIKRAKLESGMWQNEFAKSLRVSRKRYNKISQEEWLGLEEYMTNYLGDIVFKIKSGNFEIKPVKTCEELRCPYKDICGYDPNIYEKKTR